MQAARREVEVTTVTWQIAVGLNGLIALCYIAIASLIALGLVRTRQVSTNPLAVATMAIFYTCALHHGHHALHLASSVGASVEQVLAVRAAFGEWHTLAIDGFGALVAAVYLGLRRNFRALLNTPQMFDDQVRVAAEQRLKELAFTDLLTGVPNRAAYQAAADALAAGDPQGVAVVFLDLDGFKAVNDTHGHDVGDRVLRDVAQRLHAGCGEHERLYRLGGDEFVLLGMQHDAATGRELVRRAEAALLRPVSLREGPVVVGASAGLACGRSDEVDELLRRADQAMYEVKAARPHVPAPRAGRDVPAAHSA
jgi:diguanylate cyclase (GGDEF)-like protein